MDEASRTIVAFLEGIEEARRELHRVWSHYARRGLKVSSRCISFGPMWADGGLLLGVWVTGGDNKGYDLCVRLRWSEGEWIIQADVSREDEAPGGELFSPVLSALPEQRADDMRTCLRYLKAAVFELTRFDGIIPGPDVAR